MKTIITLFICKLLALMTSKAYCHTSSGTSPDTEAAVNGVDLTSAESAVLMSVDWDDIRDNIDDGDDYGEYWNDDRDGRK